MQPVEACRAAYHWTQVISRTLGYGLIACTIGIPFPRVGRWCHRRWCIGNLRALQIQHRLEGRRWLDEVPQCVFVANHTSQLDILVLGAWLRHDYRWLAKKELFRVPFLGWYLGLAGHIPVVRGDKPETANADLPERIHTAVAQGASLLFFPEGRRVETGSLGTFRIGAFMSAVTEDLPVVPLVIQGTGRLFGREAIDLSVDAERRCAVTVLPPIHGPAEGTPRERAEALSRRVREAMADVLAAAPSEAPALAPHGAQEGARASV